MATLSYGSKGSDVSNLQQLLNSKGYNLSVDGIFGDKTLAAVKSWQQKNGYTVDGLVGPNTLRRLGGATTNTSVNETTQRLYDELTGGGNSSATGSDGTAGNGAAGNDTTTGDGTGSSSTSTTVSGTETTDKNTIGVQAAMDAAKNNEKLADLINQLKSDSYMPLTPEQIKQQAENQYKSYYDQLRLAANQSTDRQNLALENQKADLQQRYDKQRKNTAEQYRQAYSQADRQALSRGMQRSSYNNQSLSNIDLKAAEAQKDLFNEQATEENKISSQQTQLAAQLADQLSQYDASEAADVLKRMDELEAREYDRKTTAENNKNTLTLQIYSILNDQLQKQVEYEQWLAEFNENVRQFNAQMSQSGGGSYGGGGGSYGGGGYSGYSNKRYSSSRSSSRRTNNTSDSGLMNALTNVDFNRITAAIRRGVDKVTNAGKNTTSDSRHVSGSSSTTHTIREY